MQTIKRIVIVYNAESDIVLKQL